MNRQCVIVDDEQGALEVLQAHIRKTPNLECAGAFRSPLEAMGFLREKPVDVVFLDINMPDLNGLEFSRLIRNRNIPVIFCTAYAEYAVDSYEVEALDYLLKPVGLPRFLEAVGRLDPASSPPAKEPAPSTGERIFIKSGTRIHPVGVDEIQYLEKDGHYLVLHLGTRELVTRMSMAEALEILPADRFQRIHRSFIVHLSHIRLIQSQFVTISERELPVGDHYRTEFLARVPIQGK